MKPPLELNKSFINLSFLPFKVLLLLPAMLLLEVAFPRVQKVKRIKPIHFPRMVIKITFLLMINFSFFLFI